MTATAANVTAQTKEAVDRWISACNRVKRIESERASAACELSNAENCLGKWLVPNDAHTNEPFHIWFSSGMIEARRASENTYTIGWRKTPDPKHAMEMGLVL